MTASTGGSSISWRGVILGLFVAMLAVACGKRAAPSTEAPGDAAASADYGGEAGEAEAAPEPTEPDSLHELELELHGHEDELLAAGIDLPDSVQQLRVELGGQAGVPAAVGDDPARCGRVCDLSTTICELSQRICELADDHQDDPRYGRVCERSTLDCDRAQKACEDCE
jgi:hypothetical protein